MGYNTDYTGELKFAEELKSSDLGYLKSFFGEDIRNHPEWQEDIPEGVGFYYIDLRFLDDFSGIQWEYETEKTYDMVSQLNFITTMMRKRNPDFRLIGKFMCQGEDIEDRHVIQLDDEGWAHQHDIIITGQRVTCPHCDETFILEDAE